MGGSRLVARGLLLLVAVAVLPTKPGHAASLSPRPLAVDAVQLEVSATADYLPKECYDKQGNTQPCLLIWHAGESGRPSDSLWAVLHSEAVGHAAIVLGGVSKDKSNVKETDTYVSWWPSSGDAGVRGKSDVAGPARLHTYEEDLDPIVGEGKVPDEVIPLIGWSPSKLRKYHEKHIKPGGTYSLLGRNCVCVAYELLQSGVATVETDVPKKLTGLEKLMVRHNSFVPQTPRGLYLLAATFQKLQQLKACPSCTKKRGCLWDSLPPSMEQT